MQKLWSESLAFLLSPQSKLYVPKNTDTHIPHPILFPHLHNGQWLWHSAIPKRCSKHNRYHKGFHKGECNILTLSLHRHLLKATDSCKVYVTLCQWGMCISSKQDNQPKEKEKGYKGGGSRSQLNNLPAFTPGPPFLCLILQKCLDETLISTNTLLRWS